MSFESRNVIQSEEIFRRESNQYFICKISNLQTFGSSIDITFNLTLF